MPFLMEFARIPDVSPAYDPEWEAHGELDRAAELLARWARARDIPGATVEVVRIPGLTPTVLVDVPATDAGATGHGRRLRPLRQAAPARRVERGPRSVEPHARG